MIEIMDLCLGMVWVKWFNFDKKKFIILFFFLNGKNKMKNLSYLDLSLPTDL